MQRLALVSAFLALGIACLAQDPAAPSAPYKVPDELAGKTNPIKPTPASLAHAKKTWGYDCAVCHGANGDGKGDLASSMNPPLKDLTDPASLQGISDGELFYIIQSGKGQMSGEGERAKPDEVWNLVAYVRSLSKK
jgi:mono/diheme cytochrome c family protein